MTVAEPSETFAPLESVVQVAADHDWPVARAGDDAAVIYVEGRCGRYEVAFTWFWDIKVLHMACGFFLRLPANRRKQCDILIRELNDALWVGKFTYSLKHEMVLYRHAVLCPDEAPLSEEHGLTFLMAGLTSCDDYGMAFRMVAEGKRAQDALQANIGKTQGSA